MTCHLRKLEGIAETAEKALIERLISKSKIGPAGIG